MLTRIITPPLVEAVTTARIKTLTGTLSDSDAALLARSAREYIERLSRRTLITSVLQSVYSIGERSPDRLTLPGGPVQAVTAISYLAPQQANVPLGATAYTLVNDDLYLWAQFSPATALTITYRAGYGDTSAQVPGPLLQAVARAAVCISAGTLQMLPDDPLIEGLITPYRPCSL